VRPHPDGFECNRVPLPCFRETLLCADLHRAVAGSSDTSNIHFSFVIFKHRWCLCSGIRNGALSWASILLVITTELHALTRSMYLLHCFRRTCVEVAYVALKAREQVHDAIGVGNKQMQIRRRPNCTLASCLHVCWISIATVLPASTLLGSSCSGSTARASRKGH